jgi:Mn-containing catalase
MIGYLLVRGGVHIVAYAKALEKLTGAGRGAVAAIPSVSNKQFPEAAKLERKVCTPLCGAGARAIFTTRFGEIWNGPHPEDGENWKFAMTCRPVFRGRTSGRAAALRSRRHRSRYDEPLRKKLG